MESVVDCLIDRLGDGLGECFTKRGRDACAWRDFKTKWVPGLCPWFLKKGSNEVRVT